MAATGQSSISIQKPKTVYIDGDIPVYSIGFAGQKTTHVLTLDNGTELLYSTLKSAKASSAWQEDIHTTVIEESPIANVLHSMKLHIEKCLAATGATDYVVYLTGKNNFRDLVTKDYKQNRADVKRPIHYEALRTYLIDAHAAIVVEGCEADDAIGIAATMCPHDCTIASTDKDLNTIQGEHYNWNKDIIYNVTHSDATLFFYCQLIMGDSTDNIKGVPNKGKMAAYKLLGDIQDNAGAMFIAVEDAYIKAYGGDGNKGRAMMDMNAKLLWILNDDCDLWDAREPIDEPEDGVLSDERISEIKDMMQLLGRGSLF